MEDEEQNNNVCTPSTCADAPPPLTEPTFIDAATDFVLPVAFICVMLVLLSRIEKLKLLAFRTLLKRFEK